MVKVQPRLAGRRSRRRRPTLVGFCTSVLALALLLVFAAAPLAAQEDESEWLSVEEAAPGLDDMPALEMDGVDEFADATPTPTPVPSSTPAPTVLSIADAAGLVSPSVVQVIAAQGTRTMMATGVRVRAGLLTNAHVVRDAASVEIVGSDGKRAPATVLRTDPSRDLALLQTDLPLPAVELESAGLQRQGDEVLLLGYPLGIGGQATLTRGLLSAVRLNLDGIDLLQTDAAANPGSSGGPVLNLRGKVVGIFTFYLRGTDGLNFAVAAESVQAFLDGAPLVAGSLLLPTPTPTPTRLVRSAKELALTAGEIGPDFVVKYSLHKAGYVNSFGLVVDFWEGQFLRNGAERNITIEVHPSISSARVGVAYWGFKLGLTTEARAPELECITSTYICRKANVVAYVWLKDALDPKILDTILKKVDASAR